MSDIDRLYKNALSSIESSRRDAEYYKDICDKLVEKYLKPDIREKIKAEPYRIRTEIGTVHNEEFLRTGDRSAVSLNKIVYVLEEQVCNFGFLRSSSRDADVSLETHWETLATFKTEGEAREAAQALNTTITPLDNIGEMK